LICFEIIPADTVLLVTDPSASELKHTFFTLRVNMCALATCVSL
jgi:hypothetical protein